MNKSKIQSFFDYNVDNIYMNLLQATDHARYVDDYDHAQCLMKHLMMIIGELKELENHSSVVKPEITPKVIELTDRVYNLYRGIRDKTFPKEELVRAIWNIRKEFEKIVPRFNTEKCESIVCVIREQEENKGKEIKHKGLDEDLGLKDLIKLCWDKVHDQMPDAPVAEKFKAVWKCIKEGDPVSPEVVEEMIKSGFTPKPAPMCVLSKQVNEGLSKEEASEECIKEGKLHPINVMKFYAEKGGMVH